MSFKTISTFLQLFLCIWLFTVVASNADPLSKTNHERDNIEIELSHGHDMAGELLKQDDSDNDETNENVIPPVAAPVADDDTATKGYAMDKLIYELVQDEKKEAIRDQFENAALRAIALKTKLDIRIDETMLALQNLKNLRRHIESTYAFANRFVNSKATTDQIKQYVVSQLDNSVQQVEQTLNYYKPTNDKPIAAP